MARLNKAVQVAGTLTGALSCASKLSAGGTCSQAEMKAVIRTLRSAYLSAKAGKKMVEGERDRARELLSQMMNRMG